MQFTDEHKALASNVKNFAQNEIKPFVEDWEKNGHFPAHDLFKKMGNLDFLGITKSTEYVGLGLDYSYGMVFAEALGYAAATVLPLGIDVDTSTTFGCIGAANPIGTNSSGIASKSFKDEISVVALVIVGPDILI